MATDSEPETAEVEDEMSCFVGKPPPYAVTDAVAADIEEDEVSCFVGKPPP